MIYFQNENQFEIKRDAMKNYNDYEKIRVLLDLDEYEFLEKIILNLNQENVFEGEFYLIESIKKAFTTAKQMKKEGKVTYLANDAKIEKSKYAIKNAIEVLKKQNKPITAYSVSKTSRLSYNTAKKYLNQNEML